VPERFQAKACPALDAGVDTGSHEENASRQKSRAFPDPIESDRERLSRLPPAAWRATKFASKPFQAKRRHMQATAKHASQ
jgi:hypothetical protein